MLSIGSLIKNVAGWISQSTGSPETVSLWLSAVVISAVTAVISVGVIAVCWRYKALIVRDKQIRFVRILMPYMPKLGFLSALRIPTPKMKLNISGWRGLALSVGLTTAGFVLALSTVIATTDTTKIWPESGAVYSLPSLFGDPLPAYPGNEETPSKPSQTLQLNLSNASRLDKLTFENMSLGKTGLDKCIDITYASTAVKSSAYLTTDKLSLLNVSAPTFQTTASQISQLTVAGKVDGHTYSPTQSSAISDITVQSDRGAGTFTAKDSTVDRIVIKVDGTAGPVVGEVEFKNVHCSVGKVSLSNIKAGELIQDAASKFGAGTGIDSASYVISSSTEIRSGVSNLVDTPISVK